MLFTTSGKVVWQRFLSNINDIVSVALIFLPEGFTESSEFISRHIARNLCFSKFWIHMRHGPFNHNFEFDRRVGVDNISYYRTMKPCNIVNVVKYMCHVKWGRGNIVQIVIFTEMFVASIINWFLFGFWEGACRLVAAPIILWRSLISNFSFKTST